MWFIPYLSNTSTLEVDLPDYPDSGSLLVNLISPSNTVLVATASCTTDPTPTALSASIGVAALSCSLNSTAGLFINRIYNIDGNELTGGETITLKSISGSWITFQQPTLFSHLSGAQFYGTHISILVPSGASTPVRRHYRAEINYSLSGTAQPMVPVSYDVVRYYPQFNVRIADVRNMEPMLSKKLPLGTVFPALVASAKTAILNRINTRVDMGSVVGNLDFKDVMSYYILAELYLKAGSDYDEQQRRYAQRFQEEFDALLSAHTVDSNQDGQIDYNESATVRIKLVRG